MYLFVSRTLIIILIHSRLQLNSHTQCTSTHTPHTGRAPRALGAWKWGWGCGGSDVRLAHWYSRVGGRPIGAMRGGGLGVERWKKMATRVYILPPQPRGYAEMLKRPPPLQLLTDLSARVYCRSGQEERRGAQNTTHHSDPLPAYLPVRRAYKLGPINKTAYPEIHFLFR